MKMPAKFSPSDKVSEVKVRKMFSDSLDEFDEELILREYDNLDDVDAFDLDDEDDF